MDLNSTARYYSQAIRDANKQKRLDWCTNLIARKGTFDDVNFPDESTFQLECHGYIYSPLLYAVSFNNEGNQFALEGFYHDRLSNTLTVKQVLRNLEH